MPTWYGVSGMFSKNKIIKCIKLNQDPIEVRTISIITNKPIILNCFWTCSTKGWPLAWTLAAVMENWKIVDNFFDDISTNCKDILISYYEQPIRLLDRFNWNLLPVYCSDLICENTDFGFNRYIEVIVYRNFSYNFQFAWKNWKTQRRFFVNTHIFFKFYTQNRRVIIDELYNNIIIYGYETRRELKMVKLYKVRIPFNDDDGPWWDAHKCIKRIIK